jgi:hypothetical protein
MMKSMCCIFFPSHFPAKRKNFFLLFLSWLLAVLWFRSSSFPFGSTGVAECWLPLQLTRSCVPGEEEEEEEKKKYKQNTQKREREREREKTKDEKKKEANN